MEGVSDEKRKNRIKRVIKGEERNVWMKEERKTRIRKGTEKNGRQRGREGRGNEKMEEEKRGDGINDTRNERKRKTRE